MNVGQTPGVRPAAGHNAYYADKADAVLEEADGGYHEVSLAAEPHYADAPRAPAPEMMLTREESFLTAPQGGWLHNEFALQFGEGVYFSFAVSYVGRYRLSRSLRTIEFPLRNKVVREAIARIREASHARPSVRREVPKICSKFLDEHAPEIKTEDIVLNISGEGIVLATEDEEGVLANHRMTTISFAAGGDHEDYDMIAYVAKSRLGRMCYVFDCGANSNQVLATIGQAFVSATQRMEEEEEFGELAEEYEAWEMAAEHGGLTAQEYEDVYGNHSYEEPHMQMRGGANYATLKSQGRSSNGHYNTLSRGGRGSNSLYAYESGANGGEGEYGTVPGLREANPGYANANDGDDDEDDSYELAQGSGLDEANPGYADVSSQAEYDIASQALGNPAAYDMASGGAGGATYQTAAGGAQLQEANPDYEEFNMRDLESRLYEAASGGAAGAGGDATYEMAAQSAQQSSAGRRDSPTYDTAHGVAKLTEADPTYDMARRRSTAAASSLSGGDHTYDMSTAVGAAEDDYQRGYDSAIRSKPESIYGRADATPSPARTASASPQFAAPNVAPAAPPSAEKPKKKGFRGLFGRKDRKEAAMPQESPGNGPAAAVTAAAAAASAATPMFKNPPMTMMRDDSVVSDGNGGGFCGPASAPGNSGYATVTAKAEPPADGNYSVVQAKILANKELTDSVRAKPLQGRGDLLVRKLNQQNGSLSVREGDKKRGEIPQWTFIDPKKIASAREK